MNQNAGAESGPDHVFLRRPHATLLGLSFPVLVSLVAEPLTGLVDTAFVAQLGAAPLAALGVATTAISSVFWVFNFLGIGTQTEVARAEGAGADDAAREAWVLAGGLALALGLALLLLTWPVADGAVRLLGAQEEGVAGAKAYLRIRLLGGPAVLVTIAAFGALRGLQDMRTPLWIALGTNLMNAALDPLLIFGLGPVPALGLAGAAWASVASQLVGAGFAVSAAGRRLGFRARPNARRARDLLVVGSDLFLRTAALLLFGALATRAANRLGSGSGAAHQVVRQIWILSALWLDAYAVAAQSLVSHFLGAGQHAWARRVASVAAGWSLGSGALTAFLLVALTGAVQQGLVPPSAQPYFALAWWVAAIGQPVNALAFATDGVHWGTSDYRYLRNAVACSTLLFGGALFALDEAGRVSLAGIWLLTNFWMALRGTLGLLRIWPGIGSAPLRPAESVGVR